MVEQFTQFKDLVFPKKKKKYSSKEFVWLELNLSSQLVVKIFCNIINVFTFTFDQLNASLLNKSINF